MRVLAESVFMTTTSAHTPTARLVVYLTHHKWDKLHSHKDYYACNFCGGSTHVKLGNKKNKKIKKIYIYILLIIPLTELAEVHCGHGLLVYLISTSTLPD